MVLFVCVSPLHKLPLLTFSNFNFLKLNITSKLEDIVGVFIYLFVQLVLF
jgi:hypothetical protein